MYISNLNIQGFKSFLPKTKLTFGDGITCIVGPNGCGKTNIVDAIRWILGEQKTSVLRSDKMDGIIFNGTKTRKPIGFCEVSLTIHNDKGRLPVEYTDVEITRRFYRNGESEYFINKVPCRLKDIKGLFVDTGMGANAYSVIELKMIETILSQNAADRRRLIEEAAGISQYKHQKNATLRKLEATKSDLERVKDIIAEVESTVKNLNLQMKRFERHKILVEKVKNTELTLAQAQIQLLNEKEQPLREKLNKEQTDTSAMTGQVSLDESLLTEMETQFATAKDDLNNCQIELTKVVDKLRTTNNNILVWTEQKKSNELRIQQYTDEKNQSEGRIKTLESQIKEIREKIKTFQPDIKNRKEDYDRVKAEFDTLQSETETHQKQWKTLRNEYDVHMDYIHQLRAKAERARAGLEEKESGIIRLQEEIVDLEKQGKILLESEKDFKTQVKNQEHLNSKLSLKLEKLQENHSQLENSVLNKKEEIVKEESKLENMCSRLQFYTDLVENQGGRSSGIQYVMENKAQLPGICGVVSDLLDVEESHALAIEVGLGEAANYLVVDTRKNAMNILNWLKESKTDSQVSIIPLDVLPSISLNNNGSKEYVSAVQCVKSKSRFKALFNLLLHDVRVITNGMDINTIPVDNPEFNWVTLDGQFIGRKYVMKSSRGTKHAVSVGREKMIKNLKKEIFSIEKHLSDLRGNLDSTIKKADKSRNYVEIEEVSLESGIKSLSTLDKELSKIEFINSQNIDKLKKSREFLSNSKISIRNIEIEKQKMNTQLEELQLKNDAYKSEIAEIQAILDDLQSKRVQVQQTVQDARVALVEIEKEADGCEYRLNTNKKLKTDLENRIMEYDTKSKQLNTEITDLVKKTESAEMDKLTVVKKRENLQKTKVQFEKVYNEKYEEVQNLQREIREQQKKKEESLLELRDMELKIAGIEKEKELIISRIRELYHISVPKEAIDLETVNLEELKQTVQTMQRSIERIGPINMAVQEEFEEESDRLQHLQEQYDDIIESETNLEETIQKIDVEARNKLLTTFDKIADNFKKTYTMFFDGGQAHLRLIGEDADPMDCDIEIIAQPPGKRTQTLRMLSAGEKALTAISLLFAIYLVKPSPFCILDEVDAPLDDRNISKFTNALREFAKETQFIVVTHNKLTMEKSDYLYGVTQEEEGVSKIVSVKFNGNTVEVPSA